MSHHTVSTLPRISNQELSTILLAATGSNLDQPGEAKHVAIVDVRDDDHIGGHIRHSIHAPSHTHDHKIPELVRKLADKEVVVFHCALSQVRGPRAALRYVRERERLLPRAEGATEGPTSVGEKIEVGTDGEDAADAGGEVEGKSKGEKKEQKVYVLRGGFVEWQEKYGEDSRLTEGYEKSIWKEGYWM